MKGRVDKGTGGEPNDENANGSASGGEHRKDGTESGASGVHQGKFLNISSPQKIPHSLLSIVIFFIFNHLFQQLCGRQDGWPCSGSVGFVK